MPSHRHDELERAAARAIMEAGLSWREGPQRIHGSVLLKYALVLRLEQSPYTGCTNELRECAAEQAPEAAMALAEAAQSSPEPPCDPLEFLRLAHYPYALQRIANLAADTLISERLCPEVEVRTETLTPGQVNVILGGARPHAVVFDAFPHVANELYPLMVDAVAAGGGQAVIGVHSEWIRCTPAQGRSTPRAGAARAILYDARRDVLVEASVPEGEEIGFASALLLCLGPEEERDRHRALSVRLSRCKVAVRNPYRGSALADNKSATVAAWRKAGLATPKTVMAISLSGLQAGVELLSRYGCTARGLVLKPNMGTEGRRVTVLPTSLEGALDPNPLQQALADTLHQDGGWLVQELRGNVGVRAEAGRPRCAAKDAAPVPVVFRLVVSAVEGAWEVESGFAVAAARRDLPASPSRGGVVLPLAEAWGALASTDPPYQPIAPTERDWRTLVRAAEEGAQALAAVRKGAFPTLLGLDILLERGDDGRLNPVLLEANARPAGLGHCRFVARSGPGYTPGVSLRIWRRPNP